LLSNTVGSGSGGLATTNGLARVTTSAATFANNHSATITIVSGSTTFVGPAVRIQGTTNGQCYIAYHDTANWIISKQTNSGTGFSLTQIGTNITGSAPTAGDTVTLEASGTTTTNLNIRVNGSSVGNRDDSSSPYTNGQPGLWTGSSLFVDGYSAADL
jgi:hypothetical protein